jgi:hypothetical protein
VKKEALAAAFTLTLLFSAVAATQFVNLGRANPYQDRGSVPPDATTKPPEITVFSPLNDSVYTKNTIPLSINVTLPESATALGTIIYYITYQTDWQQKEVFLYLNTGLANSIESYPQNPENRYFQNSQNLTDMPEGNHSITITAVAGGFYPADNMGFYRFMINGSSSVFFTTDTLPPNILVLSIENKTYTTNDVALNFTVDERASQITYSLNGQENVTIAGNTTLTGLPNGDYNLTVYATDGAGYVGASETMCFCVEVPKPFPTTLVVASTVSVALVGVGLLAYLKKHNH